MTGTMSEGRVETWTVGDELNQAAADRDQPREAGSVARRHFGAAHRLAPRGAGAAPEPAGQVTTPDDRAAVVLRHLGHGPPPPCPALPCPVIRRRRCGLVAA
jgi:hypothetical protein